MKHSVTSFVNMKDKILTIIFEWEKDSENEHFVQRLNGLKGWIACHLEVSGRSSWRWVYTKHSVTFPFHHWVISCHILRAIGMNLSANRFFSRAVWQTINRFSHSDRTNRLFHNKLAYGNISDPPPLQFWLMGILEIRW